MPWKIIVGDKSMLLDDLSGDDIYRSCVEFPEITWMQMWRAPAMHPAACYKLVCLVAEKLEQPSPPKPSNVREDMQFIVDHLEQVEDDLPNAFDEAGIPLEDTEDAKETTTSSTSTELDSGLLTEPVAPV